jgi:hypothetical protein
MIIARFGPSTAWNGRTIAWEDGRFVLQDHGEVPAQSLLDYDRQGQLAWEYDGLREWVTGVAAAAQAPGARYPEGALLGGHSPRFPVWAIVLIAAGVLVLFGGMFAAMAIPVFLGQRDLAKESAVKEGIHSIQVGVQSWAVDHADEYPDPATVSQAGMSRYVDRWPTNPYTGLAMTQGTGPGQFTYTGSDGGGFQLTAYGADGTPVITVP